ncbi:MAG: nucleotidyltransferase substrate binding protein [Spirochaetaceae bacterium]|jgi:nucleotidyltransferase substrate binding protein (TIGR01987 family)|nr:nucleotidyltransferase substrate binding protein [Spirochaetaceae bacterium]
MNNRERWKQRFDNFSSAFATLVRIKERFALEGTDEALRMALVQAFEFTYELAWNTMKDYLENEGFDAPAGSKQTIRLAFQAGLIEDAEQWMEAVQKRNMASHTYNQSVLDEGVAFINGAYFPLVEKLHAFFKERRCEDQCVTD